MIRWFEDSIVDLREKNFIILWFDESIVDLKEKYFYFYDSPNRSTIRRFDQRFKRKKFIFSWFDDSTIRSSIWRKNIFIFMIRRFDRRFDDSINDLKEKNLYFHDSMIRRFDRRFERKKFYNFMIRRIDRRFEGKIFLFLWFAESIDDSTIRSTI